MAAGFKIGELMALYKNKKKQGSTFTLPEKIEGKSMLQKAEKLYYLTSSRSIQSNQSSHQDERKTIAICLIIVDNLSHEDIWRQWAKEGETHGENSPYRVKFFIHAKQPERIVSDWTKKHTLKISFRPEWNSVEVIRAMMLCLKEAVKDESCGRFIFCTESCIPIRSLHETGTMLYSSNRSWLDCYHRPKSTFEERSCFLAVNMKMIPNKCVWKALPGWIMLVRSHADEICRLQSVLDEDLISAWNTVFAPEEMFFATVLCLLGYLRDGQTPNLATDTAEGRVEWERGDEVWRRRVTFAKWARNGDARPVAYDRIDTATLQMMRDTGAVFGRKFGRGGQPLTDWKEAVRACAELEEKERLMFEKSGPPVVRVEKQEELAEDCGSISNHVDRHDQMAVDSDTAGSVWSGSDREMVANSSALGDSAPGQTPAAGLNAALSPEVESLVQRKRPRSESVCSER